MPHRVTDRDQAIVRIVVEWGVLTVSEIRAIALKQYDLFMKPVVARRRIQALGQEPRKRDGRTTDGLRFLRRIDQPENKWGEQLNYADQRALDLAYSNGWISGRMRAAEKKRSNTKLLHDRLVICFRFVLFDRYGSKLIASRFLSECSYGKGKDKKGNEKEWFADQVLFLDHGGPYPLFFLEWENTDEHSYANGVSERMQKAEQFVRFVQSGALADRFRYPEAQMIFVVPTAKQARNFVMKLHAAGGDLDSPLFLVTDFDSALCGATDIYMMPRDFDTRRYSLETASAEVRDWYS